MKCKYADFLNIKETRLFLVFARSLQVQCLGQAIENLPILDGLLKVFGARACSNFRMNPNF